LIQITYHQNKAFGIYLAEDETFNSQKLEVSLVAESGFVQFLHKFSKLILSKVNHQLVFIHANIVFSTF